MAHTFLKLMMRQYLGVMSSRLHHGLEGIDQLGAVFNAYDLTTHSKHKVGDIIFFQQICLYV